MQIYGLPISLYSFKLRLAARLMGLPLEMQAPPGGTYRSPEYQAIVPSGTIPALVDGDFVLSEAEVIIEYLSELGPPTPILPADAKARARQRMISRWCDLRLEPAVRTLFPMVAVAGAEAEAIAAADGRIAAALALIEGALDAEGPFTGGSAPGLADCALAATLAWHTTLTAPLGLTSAPGPRLARALQAMTAHPELADSFAEYEQTLSNWLVTKLQPASPPTA